MEGFTTASIMQESGMLIGLLAVQQGTSDLNTIGDAEFFVVGKFGGSSSAGSSGGDASTNTSSSTLNRVCLFADTTGKLLKESTSVVITGANITGVDDLTVATKVVINGNVSAATSGTPVVDLSVAVFDGVAGDVIKETGVLIDASNNITGVNDLTASNDVIINGDSATRIPTPLSQTLTIPVFDNVDGTMVETAVFINGVGTMSGMTQLLVAGTIDENNDPVAKTTNDPVTLNSVPVYDNTNAREFIGTGMTITPTDVFTAPISMVHLMNGLYVLQEHWNQLPKIAANLGVASNLDFELQGPRCCSSPH